MRWAELVALLTTIGLIIFRLAVLPPSKWPDELVLDATDRAVRLARAVVLLFAICTLTRAFAQADLIPNAGNGRFGALMTLYNTPGGGGGDQMPEPSPCRACWPRKARRWITVAIGVVAICTSEAPGQAGVAAHAAIAIDVAHVLGAGGGRRMNGPLRCPRSEHRRRPKTAADLSRHGECVMIVVATGGRRGCAAGVQRA